MGEWNFDHYVKILSLTYSFPRTIIEDHINYGAHCKDYNSLNKAFIIFLKKEVSLLPRGVAEYLHLLTVQT